MTGSVDVVEAHCVNLSGVGTEGRVENDLREKVVGLIRQKRFRG